MNTMLLRLSSLAGGLFLQAAILYFCLFHIVGSWLGRVTFANFFLQLVVEYVQVRVGGMTEVICPASKVCHQNDWAWAPSGMFLEGDDTNRIISLGPREETSMSTRLLKCSITPGFLVSETLHQGDKSSVMFEYFVLLPFLLLKSAHYPNQYVP